MLRAFTLLSLLFLSIFAHGQALSYYGEYANSPSYRVFTSFDSSYLEVIREAGVRTLEEDRIDLDDSGEHEDTTHLYNFTFDEEGECVDTIDQEGTLEVISGAYIYEPDRSLACQVNKPGGMPLVVSEKLSEDHKEVHTLMYGYEPVSNVKGTGEGDEELLTRVKHFRNGALQNIHLIRYEFHRDASKQNEEYQVTFHSDDGKVTERVEIKDTALRKQLHRMLKGQGPGEGADAHEKDTVFNSGGDPVLVRLGDDLFGASLKKYEYDDQGRVVRITGYDENEKVSPFHKDIAIRVHEYDDKGRLVEIRNYGEDRELIASEYEDSPIIRMKYNEKGQLIEKRFYNEEGDLRSDFAISKYAYDEKGERVHKGLFKKNGEPYGK